MSNDIHKAVKLAKNDVLQKLLMEGANVNARNENLDTPLHIAVHQNSEKSVEILLAYGADVSIKNGKSETPMDVAIDLKSSEIVNILLKYRADYVITDALKSWNRDLVKFLLERVANVNTATESGITPLHYAIECLFPYAADLLLDYGADAKTKDIKGLSVFHKVAMHGAPIELMDRLLEKGASLNAKDNDGLTPLIYAVHRQQASYIVSFILDKNPNLNDKANKLAFCLSFLEKDRSPDNVAAIFLKRGFTLSVQDFNEVFLPNKLFSSVRDKLENKEFRTKVQDSFKKTATNFAEFDKLFLLYEVLKGSIERGFIGIVHNLLPTCVNVNIPFTDGLTMLQTAVINGHLPVVEKLFAYGADVNALGTSCKTSALYHSISTSYYQNVEKIVTVLLKNNANTEVGDNIDTPLERALFDRNYKIALLLLNAGAKVISARRKNIISFLNSSKTKSDFVKAVLYFSALIDHQHFLNLFAKSNFQETGCSKRVKLFFNHTEVCTSDASAVLKLKDFKTVSSEIRKLLIKYIALQGRSLYYDSSESEFYTFQTECQEEIKRMKLTKIGGFEISVDTLLRTTPDQIAQGLKNANFVHALGQMDVKNKFPLYGSKIKAHVKKGEVRKRLLDLSYTCYEDSLYYSKLGKGKDISHLDDQELRRLIFTSPIDEVKRASLGYKDDGEQESGDDEDHKDVYERDGYRDHNKSYYYSSYS